MQNPQRMRVKRIIKNEEIAKEGAWKLAYADFVTAMMCFFMLMWLLNSTPAPKLQNMSNYFKPTFGFFNNNITIDENNSNQAKDPDNNVTEILQGKLTDHKDLSNLQAKIHTELFNNDSTNNLMSNVSLSITDDGLEISIFDNNTQAMFGKGSATLTKDAQLLLKKITKIIQYTPNKLIIGGYTEKLHNTSLAINGWMLSMRRADAAREAMEISGLSSEKIAKLVAYSDNVPLDDNDPSSPLNRRITITLMNQWIAAKYKMPISTVD